MLIQVTSHSKKEIDVIDEANELLCITLLPTYLFLALKLLIKALSPDILVPRNADLADSQLAG